MTPGFKAAVLIPYRDGKFLLQHRADTVKRWPDYWSSFGGGLEPGETKEEALKRELREELGYTLKNPKYAFFYELEGGGNYVFYEYWDGSEKYQLDPKESVGHNWFSLEEARATKITPHDLETLEKLSELLKTDLGAKVL